MVFGGFGDRAGDRVVVQGLKIPGFFKNPGILVRPFLILTRANSLRSRPNSFFARANSLLARVNSVASRPN
jgi:hypothetical protein